MIQIVLIAVALMTLAGCGNGGETARGGGGVAGAAGATTGGGGGFAGDAAVGGASGAAGMGGASGQAGSAGGAGAGGASGTSGGAGIGGASGAAGGGGAAGGNPGTLVVYDPLPQHRYESAHYEVSVCQGGICHSSYVYQSDVDTTYNSAWALAHLSEANHWTSFSFDGSVTVQVTVLGGADVDAPVIRPESYGIAATATGSQVSFSLDEPANVYVEIPGKEKHPLFVFANPVEVDPPQEGAPGVVYFAPGYHDVGKTEYAALPSGTTVYIAGGAYVRGLLKSQNDADDITIRGRGVLSGMGYPNPGTWTDHMIELPSGAAQNLVLEGLVFTDMPKAAVIAHGKMLVDNVKIFGWHHNNDGIRAGAGSIIRNSFFKTMDDVIKLYSSNMQVSHNVIWMQLTGAAFQLSWNLKQDVTSGTVSDIDFIHFDRPASDVNAWYNNAVVGCRNIDGAKIGGITFENFRFDAPPYQLFALRIKDDLAGYTSGLGTIDGLLFKDFALPGDPLTLSIFDGNGSQDGWIRNVAFEGIKLGTDDFEPGDVVRNGSTSDFAF